ncbi:Zn(II)2Cys6 transcription factor [Aspergillus puulaauensis]|uniref:Zn(2)-C6 fungal-type domain-containing protein n=1 Tax=Aspergillus puulaauensis TaxID=1220207 RepID=A0A7R8AQ16_9EURO|nr:uncharacterized protein APUU_60074S [Aspergillus puulaauensis]BCS27026.1 hypothetical protein APUU_60074S [Aspergillus puulaauensis]
MFEGVIVSKLRKPSISSAWMPFTMLRKGATNPSRASLTKQACDGCKVRKVRCGGGNPCRPCLSARIQCSYKRTQQTRGPQKLRTATRRLIEQSQRNDRGRAESTEHSEGASESARLPANTLVSLLYIYHVRMYPVWPVVDVESLIAALQRDPKGQDYETRALATGLAAATVAQLRLGENSISDPSLTANALAAECLETRRAFDYRSRVNLNNIRTAFFLHVYYENQQPGGSESILYLREAITMAQLMYLHREASYISLSIEEQRIRRRVLWLLFVTERGVCILHKLPVVLKTDTAMPEIDTNDEPQVLPAFLKLLALFRLFEQTRMFDIVEDYHLGMQPPIGSAKTPDTTFDEILQDRFRDGAGALDRASDVQRADLCVTRHWMRILAWKALSNSAAGASHVAELHLSPVFPLLVARDLVSVVCRLPRTALQAHGLGMQMKLHEIANSLVDAITTMPILTQTSKWGQETRPSSLLSHLHSFLSTFTDGGNNALVDMLYRKMAHAHSVVSSTIPPLLTCIHPVKNRSLVQDTEPTAWDGGSSTKDSTDTNAANWLEGEGAPGSPSHATNRVSLGTPDGATDAATASVSLDFDSQQFGDPWSYVQSSYDPLIYTLA